MKLVPGNHYVGKITGEFKLVKIRNINGNPVFVVTTPSNESGFELSLDEMKQENVKNAK